MTAGLLHSRRVLRVNVSSFLAAQLHHFIIFFLLFFFPDLDDFHALLLTLHLERALAQTVALIFFFVSRVDEGEVLGRHE